MVEPAFIRARHEAGLLVRCRMNEISVSQRPSRANNAAMTLKESEDITTHLINLMAANPPNACCRASQLRGHTLPVFHDAFCLIIAKQRQIASNDPKLREVSCAYADKADVLVRSLSIAVLYDDDMDRLEKLEKGSPEFNRVLIDAVQRRMAQRDLEWKKKPNHESLASFNEYCWSLNPNEPLYWQKIYTQLDMPYDENSPSGLPEMALDDGGHFAWHVESVKSRRKMPHYQILLWAVGAVVLIWLLAKVAS
jgi:hypothetical protein